MPWRCRRLINKVLINRRFCNVVSPPRFGFRVENWQHVSPIVLLQAISASGRICTLRRRLQTSSRNSGCSVCQSDVCLCIRLAVLFRNRVGTKVNSRNFAGTHGNEVRDERIHRANRCYWSSSLSMPDTSTTSITVIEPPSGLLYLNLPEVWRYRDLLMLLAWRDISARFRQSLVGYGWAILKPLMSAIIYTLVFSVFVRIETVVPYPIFAFAALIPWMYFSSSLSGITSSVVGGGSLLTKVYFPDLCFRSPASWSVW